MTYQEGSLVWVEDKPFEPYGKPLPGIVMQTHPSGNYTIKCWVDNPANWFNFILTADKLTARPS